MLYLFHGADEYTASAEAEARIRSLAGDDQRSAVVRLEGGSVSWEALRTACASQGLFSTIQVVVLRGLLTRWSGRGEGGAKTSAKPSATEFSTFAGSLASSSVLVLVEGELGKDNRYLKALSALGKDIAMVHAFVPPAHAERRDWVARTVRARGGVIEQDVADLLGHRVPKDLGQLSHEIDKLLCYTAPEGRISRQDVLDLVAEPDSGSGFDLVDAVCKKQGPRVVELAHRLLAEGMAPEQVLALLGLRVRDLLLLATARAEGIPAKHVGTRAGWSDGRRSHLERDLSAFSLRELIEAQSLLVAADLALKSRPMHERPNILILTLLSIAQRTPAARLEGALRL